MTWLVLAALSGCNIFGFGGGGGGAYTSPSEQGSRPSLEPGSSRPLETKGPGLHTLINAGSQQGRPAPPVEALTRSQCSDMTDGGDVDDYGITGRIECGEQIVGHTRGGVQAFDTEFYETHFCTPATTNHSGGDERVYRLSVPDGRLRPWVTLDTPCADLDLTVIKWSGRELPTTGSSVADCEMFPKDGTTREIVDVTSDRASEWLIVVEGKDDEEGAFGLSVQCVPW